MCPSTSWCTRAGSQLGICPAIAVTIPKEKEAKPSRPRTARTARSRSFRILRRLPFPDASPLRLRRNNKRRILARSGGHTDERGRGGRLDPVLLLRDQHGCAVRNGLLERNGGEGPRRVECPCPLGVSSRRHPRLLDHPGPRR